MKKALIIILFLVLVILASSYLFIPSQIPLSVQMPMKANIHALYRNVSNEGNWHKWWPKQYNEEINGGVARGVTLNESRYELKEKLYNAVDIDIVKAGNAYDTKLVVIPVSKDSLLVIWGGSLTAGMNPYERVCKYWEARSIKKNSLSILSSLKSFIENKKNIYRFNIRHTTITDTFFVAKKTVTKDSPATGLLYSYIGHLQKYVAHHKAQQVGSPIANVTKKGASEYELMVAVPTNKQLPSEKDIAFKRMIVYKNRVLTADVLGGPEMIRQAYDELKTYMNDYNLVSPVISWEMLVTDRLEVKDSSKWVTRIFVPIV